MSASDDLISLARKHQFRNPDLALSAVRNVLNFEPMHDDARLIAAAINPYAWTGLAMMTSFMIFLHEKGLPLATVATPNYQKLQIKPNNLIVHENTLYVSYGRGNKPTHLLSFDSDGFTPLRELKKGTQHLASNWEESEITLLRNPKPAQTGIPIAFERDAVLFTVQDGEEIVLGRNTRDGDVTLVGTTYGIFYSDNEITARRNGYGDNAAWEDFATNTCTTPILLERQIDLPENSRYLRQNRADHPGNTAAIYTPVQSTIRRIAIEVPITLCDALRLESERQAKKWRDEERLP